jgi:hypothetical protein
MTIGLLIIHGLVAVFLLGALTHQALAATWPRKPGETDFVARYRGTNGPGYANAVVVLFIATFILGGIVYTFYRTQVRPPLEALQDLRTVGLFELKEHYLAIALAMLPAYWYYWRRRPDATRARAGITVVLAVSVWAGFIIGHIINNVRGLV